MIPDLIPPTLEDMGFILQGADWGTLMATSLGPTDEELAGWEDDPASISGDIATKLLELRVIRSREIGKMHDRLKAEGLRRAPADLSGRHQKGYAELMLIARRALG